MKIMLRALLLLILVQNCLAEYEAEEIITRLTTPDLELQVNGEMYTKLSRPGQVLSDFEPRDYVLIQGESEERTEFLVDKASSSKVDDKIGSGESFTLVGRAGDLQKTLTLTSYQDFPNFVICDVSYKNVGQGKIKIAKLVSNAYRFKVPNGTEPAVWSFQGASYEDRYDWVRPLAPGGGEDNYLGMNATDYGGGIPVLDAWTRDYGVAVGLLSLTPPLVKMPLDRSEEDQTFGFEIVKEEPLVLDSGDRLATEKSFLCLHQGDYFNTLLPYAEILKRLGLARAQYPDSSYEPVWCGWGYQRKVTLEQMLKTLPKAKELGFKWAVLDDGWQTAEGDWILDGDKFPQGSVDMRAFTDAVRAQGMRPKLWWAPLAVDPGTELLKEHKDYLLLNKDGSPRDITWWDSYYLCPAYPPVHEYSRQLVTTMMGEWNYDGLKIDGQHLNAAPPCYNPVHNHKRPEESSESVPRFFKLIYETARQNKADAVVEICPCGTTYALHSLGYTNQAVSSDPESSFQIRHKAKTLKALMGQSSPYYGDHVELSDGGDDFASTVGVGGVIGSKFTLPGFGGESGTELDSGKELKWSLWSKIYQDKMLPKGVYRGELYDIGFDKPEAHLVEKDSRLYYAFYASRHSGPLELRGLDSRAYQVRDYVKNIAFGTVSGPQAKIETDFSGYLLLEATPKE